MCGWIRLHRKLMDSPVYHDSVLLHVWIHCLMSATHKPITTLLGRKSIDLAPGQFVSGRKRMAYETGLSEKQVRCALVSLTVLKMLTCTTSQGQDGTVITICNWGTYQDSEISEGQVGAKKGPSEGQVRATIQEYKEVITTPHSSNELCPPLHEPLDADASSTCTAIPNRIPQPLEKDDIPENALQSPRTHSNDNGATMTPPKASKAKQGANASKIKASETDFSPIKAAWVRKRPQDCLTSQGKSNILRLLKSGQTLASLVRCVERYQDSIADDEDPMIFAIDNFFGPKKAYWERFNDEHAEEQEATPTWKRHFRLENILAEYGIPLPSYSEEEIARIRQDEEAAQKRDAELAAQTTIFEGDGYVPE